MTRRGRRVLAEVLVRSVLEHDWRRPPDGMAELVAGADLSALTGVAGFHGVTGCVHRSLRGLAEVPHGTLKALEESQNHSLQTHLRALADLQRVAPVLQETGVPWLVVKGPVLSAGVYARPDLRAYGDVDVVVPAPSLGRVLEALERAGSRLVDRNWVLLRRQLHGEVHLVLPYGTVLDLHWHLLNQAALRDVFPIPMGDLFERARPVHLGSVATLALGPVEALVHLALHSCLSGGNRLVWIKDVERTIAVDAPPWEEVVRRCREWRVGLPVAATLRQSRTVLGAAVPDEVLDELAPSRAWRALTTAAGRVWPVERSRGERSPARMLARSSRADARSSAVELGRHLAGLARGNPLDRRPATDDIDPSSPTSILHEAGDHRDRAAFLEAVAGAVARSGS